MTDDYEPGSIPDSESEEMTEAKKKALDNLPSKNERYKEPSQLPNWTKLAIAKYELGYHDTLQEAADARGKGKSTLAQYRYTPAGKKYRERFKDVLDDPSRIAETLLRGELAGFTLDFMEMWQTAVDSNDYAEVRKMWESINDRVPGGLSKRGSDSGGGATINVTFGGVPLEVESEFEEIEADYEVVDGDD